MEKKTNILLIDESELIIFYLKIILMDLKGISNVEITHNLTDAKKTLAKQAFDFIVVDLQSQGREVLSFLKWVKNNYSSTKLIVFSNYAGKNFHDACKTSGADYFFDKSLEVDKLVGLFIESRSIVLKQP